ncbi:hypothetical protein [Corynebacterium massiliense]|uniref:Uncharacterized protein n=1 Tax=Corynebacterium massiliense DSM 45435 TaxID=1121364 RepID=A0ABY7UC46_9CORY|nr:hypothetical protein [Corynebacterium massiliense]WCZ33032.1 hypothetical protein CMASS_08020 [Corynebacterium massiliense DSM 45435]
MILQKATMRRAYDAAGMTVTNEELDEQYERMQQEWEDLLTANETMVLRRYSQQTGIKVADGLTRHQLLNQARMLTDDQIKERYLEPLNQIIAERELEKERAREIIEEDVLASEDLWKTKWSVFPADHWGTRLVRQLYPNKPGGRWELIAGALILVRDYQGIGYPAHPEQTEILGSFEKTVDQALEEYNEYRRRRKLRLK